MAYGRKKYYDDGRSGDRSSVPYVAAAASPGQGAACGGHREPGSTYMCGFQRLRRMFSQNEPVIGRTPELGLAAC